MRAPHDLYLDGVVVGFTLSAVGGMLASHIKREYPAYLGTALVTCVFAFIVALIAFKVRRLKSAKSQEKSMPVTLEDIENWFSYHPPRNDSELYAYQQIRAAAIDFAKVVLDLTPPSPDQTVAVRKIREAVMTANASIACYQPGR